MSTSMHPTVQPFQNVPGLLLFTIAFCASCLPVAHGQTSILTEKTCEAEQIGVGYGLTRNTARKNAEIAWKKSAKKNFKQDFELKTAHITTNYYCQNKQPGHTSNRPYGAKNFEENGNPDHAWNCMITAQPCVKTGENPEETQPPVSLEQAKNSLKHQGFMFVRLAKEKTGFSGSACKKRQAFQMTLSQSGRIIQKQDNGQCPHGGLSRVQVQSILKKKGYNDIRVWQAGRRYQAHVCNGTRKLKLFINRWGDIDQKRQEGRCQNASRKVARIEERLYNQGYRNIHFMKSAQYPYKIQACKQGRAYKLTVPQQGSIETDASEHTCPQDRQLNNQANDETEIFNRDRAGYNEPEPIQETETEREIRQQLGDIGYYHIRITDRQEGEYRILACQRRRQYVMFLTPSGRIIERHSQGQCRQSRERDQYREPAGEYNSNQDYIVQETLPDRPAGSTPSQARHLLVRKGYTGIRYKGKADRDGHRFSVCEGSTAYRIIVEHDEIALKKRRKGLASLSCVRF